MRPEIRYAIRSEATLSHRIAVRLADILWHRHFEIAELFGSIFWAGWSLVLLNPWANTFVTAPAYRAMASLAPEGAWGWVGLLLAVSEFCAMTSEHRIWRIAAAGLLFGWALFIGTMLGLSNPVGTGAVVYTTVGLLSLFAFLRAFREAA